MINLIRNSGQGHWNCQSVICRIHSFILWPEKLRNCNIITTLQFQTRFDFSIKSTPILMWLLVIHTSQIANCFRYDLLITYNQIYSRLISRSLNSSHNIWSLWPHTILSRLISFRNFLSRLITTNFVTSNPISLRLKLSHLFYPHIIYFHNITSNTFIYYINVFILYIQYQIRQKYFRQLGSCDLQDEEKKVTNFFNVILL